MRNQRITCAWKVALPMGGRHTEHWVRELVREIRRNGRWRQQGFGAPQLVRRQQPPASSCVEVLDTLPCWGQCCNVVFYLDVTCPFRVSAALEATSTGGTLCISPEHCTSRHNLAVLQGTCMCL